MKTESTEKLREKANCLKYNFGIIHSNPQLILEESFISGVKYGQSSPKIKQLEWDFYGTYYSAETPVGHYVILDGDEQYLENYITCTLTYNGSLIADFNSIKEAKSAAQADYERRVRECLDL